MDGGGGGSGSGGSKKIKIELFASSPIATPIKQPQEHLQHNAKALNNP